MNLRASTPILLWVFLLGIFEVESFVTAGFVFSRCGRASPQCPPPRLRLEPRRKCSQWIAQGGNVPDEGRRTLVAALLSPVFTIFTMYAGVPTLLGSDTRAKDWYKENFATAMENMDGYEAGVAQMKKDLFSLINPTNLVLDLGAGLGPNVKYFPANISYVAVEPNPFMHDSINKQADLHLKGPATIFQEMSSVVSSSQDVVVSTLVLCSVENQKETISEILRVLKPGGIFIFLEHVIAQDQGYPTPANQGSYKWGQAMYRWSQVAMKPLQIAFADGCDPSRDTIANIQDVFSDVFYKSFDVPYLWGSADWWTYFPIGPQVAGVAIKKPRKYAGQLAEIQFKYCASGAKPILADPIHGDPDAQRELQDKGGAVPPTDSLKCR